MLNIVLQQFASHYIIAKFFYKICLVLLLRKCEVDMCLHHSTLKLISNVYCDIPEEEIKPSSNYVDFAKIMLSELWIWIHVQCKWLLNTYRSCGFRVPSCDWDKKTTVYCHLKESCVFPQLCEHLCNICILKYNTASSFLCPLKITFLYLPAS